MAPENVIEVNNVTKNFKIYYDKGSQLKEKLLFRKRNHYEERAVLKGISFNVAKGEAVGLIGQNGCGKSTTLKLLTKIIYPNSGTIKMTGRVTSLIELGAGFHPDMSGRENIYTNAAIFGLNHKEIDSRLEDIIAFSELWEFIDNPVRTYSSGMYMRLAFSVAINVDADILLIDEILAVGDVNFQAKCFRRLKEIKEQGTTIVIVSHSMEQIEQICDRSIWIQDGQIRGDGKPRDVKISYMAYMRGKREEIAEKEVERQEQKQAQLQNGEDAHKQSGQNEECNAFEKEGFDPTIRSGNAFARIESVLTYNAKGERKRAFRTGETLNLKFSYKVTRSVKDAVLGIGIYRSDGIHCYGCNTKLEQFESFDLNKDGEVTVVMDALALLPGDYWLNVTIESGDGVSVDCYTKACEIEIYSDVGDVGVARLEHRWFLDDSSNKKVEKGGSYR